MNKQQETEIGELMKQYAAKQEQQERRMSENQRAGDEFYAAFGKALAEVIKPTMEKIGEQLKGGGHTIDIEETDSTSTRTGAQRPGSIRFRFLLAGIQRERYGNHGLPGVTFSAESAARVGVSKRSGSSQGARQGRPQRFLTINDVTPELVTAEILEVLKTTIGPSSRPLS